MFWRAGLFASVLLVWAGLATSTLPKLHAVDGRFVDAAGSEVLLRGTSCDYNFQEPHMSEAQIDVLQSLGWNFVRLGFHWHLYETAPGVWNETYLEGVATLVKRFEAAGLYVLLDMHQDNWSPLYCGGHGIPSFYGMPADEERFWRGGVEAYPWPLAAPAYAPSGDGCVPSPSNATARFCPVADCSNVSATPLGWASTYATAAVGSAAQRLYSNTGGARDAFAAFWGRAAARLGGSGGVVGLGLINEPWLGDIWGDPSLLLPGESDRRNLQPLYAAVAAAVRAVDADTPVWFEPATGGNILDALPAGFTAPPDSNAALGYHVYCPALQSDLPHPGARNDTRLWEELELCQALNGAQFDVRQSDAERLGVPGVLTEFGSVDQLPQTEALLRWTADEMDRRLAGWAYWLLNPSTDPSRPNWELPVLRRPFPQSVPGRLAAVAWNATLATLRVTFSASSASNPRPAARVFAPASCFGGQVPTLASLPAAAVASATHNATTGVFSVVLNATLPAGTNVTLTVSR